MGFLNGVSSIASPARIRAGAGNYSSAFFGGDDLPNSWVSTLSAAGVSVTPDLAMTLSAMYCGVTTICYDLATLPLYAFRNRDDGGKDLVRGRSADYQRGGIADLAYMLRWAPNKYQTASEYFASQIAQFLLRDVAYAEIISGPSGFLEQLLPRHPDRVTPERLPNGHLRYRLIEANGQARYVTQEEMHVVRGLSTDGLQRFSRTAYGAGAIGSALAAERAAGKFFKSGMTAAVVATYKGDMEDEDEAALHKSISRYAAGVENTFGLLLIPDDVTVSNLGIEPEKAQMMLAREWGVYEIARLLRIRPRKLMAGGKPDSYASAYQDGIDHAVNCIRPTAVTFEQAMQRDLILAKDTYQLKFHLRELLQGDPSQMGALIEQLIRNRVMTPSEARMAFMDLNPDAHLDQLSESDNRPGAAATKPASSDQPSRASLKAMLAVHDNAVRCLRRERVAVEKLAKKHPSDVEAWKRGLRDLLGEHATFVAQTMRISIARARGYVGLHGSALEVDGIAIYSDEWERYEADELAVLALDADAAA